MYNVMCPVRTVHFNREIRTINGHNLPLTRSEERRVGKECRL